MASETTVLRLAHLSQRLLLAGLSPRRIRRLVAEIEAHRDDLIAELQSAGLPRAQSEAQAAARLGSEDALVASILARPELRAWSVRWPWAAFAALPLLAYALLFVLSMAVMAGIVSFCIHVFGVVPARSRAINGLCEVLVVYALWVAPLTAAGAACFLAARRRVAPWWPVIGCTLIALVGALTNAGFQWSPTHPHGTLMAGIGFPGRGPVSAIRLAVTLLAILVPFGLAQVRRPARERASAAGNAPGSKA